MGSLWRQSAGWYFAGLVALLPLVAVWRPEWLPAGLVLLWLADRAAGRAAVPRLWIGLGQLASGLVAVGLVLDDWRPVVGWAAAAAVAAGTRIAWRGDGGRRHAITGVVGAVWATPFILEPALVGPAAAGAVAAAVVLFGAMTAGSGWGDREQGPRDGLGPPSREVRGTVVLRGVVLGDVASLPLSVPLDLEIRAGESIAVLHDSEAQAEALAETIAARRQPVAGEVSIDGVPPAAGERLVAIVGRGETLVIGDVVSNVAALSEPTLSGGTLEAVREACSLADVEQALDGRRVAADGEPLSVLHRCLLVAARVVPSDYRVVVVVDPLPWVNAVRAEQWRTAVVRASLGRSAIWLTTDRVLASRADRVLELRHGGLRAVEVAAT